MADLIHIALSYLIFPLITGFASLNMYSTCIMQKYDLYFKEGEKEGDDEAEVSFGGEGNGSEEKTGEKETGEDQEPGDDDVMTIDDDEDEPEK